MTDAELQAWWPDIGQVVAELRRLGHAEVADRLHDAVAAGATSGEILAGVGQVLLQHTALNARLDGPARLAWTRVVADVDRAYPNFRARHWLARLVSRFRRR